MNPFIALISDVIHLYSLCLFVWIILGLLIHFKIVNRSHPIVDRVDYFLSRLIDPALKPIRKYVPSVGGVDISPVILVLALNFLNHALIYYSVRF